MANKQELKQSEARILIFLSQVNSQDKNTRTISSKLCMDYAYTIQRLAEMTDKGWLSRFNDGRQTMHSLTRHAPMKKAKEVLIK